MPEQAEMGTSSPKKNGTSGPKRREPAGSAEIVPKRPKANGTSRTNGCEMPEPAEKENFRTNCYGTNGTKMREPPEPGEMGTSSPKQTGTFGTNGREPAGSPEISTRSTVPYGTKERAGCGSPKEPRTNQKLPRVLTREKSKSQWASFRAPIQTNGIVPRVLTRAHKEISKESPPKGRGERIIQQVRACHVSSKWQSAGTNSKICFRLFRTLNLQIDITFDPELGFARSWYQRKAAEILYMFPG
ncbi:hypothetical protein KI387_028853, partial [Taxus chinensis]